MICRIISLFRLTFSAYDFKIEEYISFLSFDNVFAFLFDSDKATLLFDIKPSSLGTIFPGTEGRRYSAKWEENFPGYITQTTKMQFTGKGPRIIRVNTFASNFFGMWFYRKIEDFTFV
jgi:hypothetical protein